MLPSLPFALEERNFTFMDAIHFIFVGLIIFFSAGYLDLPVEYGQRGIRTDNIHQFLVSPDGHGQFGYSSLSMTMVTWCLSATILISLFSSGIHAIVPN